MLTSNTGPSGRHPVNFPSMIRHLGRKGGGRMATRRRLHRRPGELPDLRKRLWWALLRAQDVLDDPESSRELVLKAAHTIAQLGATYMNLLRNNDLEARIAALEASLQARRNGHGQVS